MAFSESDSQKQSISICGRCVKQLELESEVLLNWKHWGEDEWSSFVILRGHNSPSVSAEISEKSFKAFN